MSKSNMTPWFKMNQKPVRFGEYEARRRGSRARVTVHWKRLQDALKPGWYYDGGYLGPFHLWRDVGDTITAWRGFTEKQQ